MQPPGMLTLGTLTQVECQRGLLEAILSVSGVSCWDSRASGDPGGGWGQGGGGGIGLGWV